MRSRNRTALAPKLSLLVAALVGLSACKGGDGPGETPDGEAADDGTVVDGRRSAAVEFNAADATYLQKNANFYFRVFDDAFSKRLDDLPDHGEVPDAKKPHSGGYYAEGDGGTNQIVAGNKSPLQKYDQAFNNGETKAADWEQAKHTTGPEWAGHCNGFSATTQRHPKEPDRNVTRNGVTFAPQDVKALLAEIHMNADYEFLGGNRCDIVGTPPAPGARVDPTVMGVCEDINPGTLHAAMSNWIGRMKHTLIMDMYSGDQVWNYPLYKYDVIQNVDVTAAEAKQYVTGGGGTYVFNPSATKFRYIEAQLTYAEASKRELLDQLIPKTMHLTYVLELDAAGEILGGEWVGAQSQKTHPDFLWVALEPLEPNGTRYMGNPHLNNQEVIKLWAESVGEDPDSPTLDIMRPRADDTWGKWPNLEATLDGNARGAVFAGKTVALRLKRKGALVGDDLLLEVALNGTVVKTFAEGEVDADADMVYSFEPGLGLSRFQLTFKRGDAVVEDQYLRFYAAR